MAGRGDELPIDLSRVKVEPEDPDIEILKVKINNPLHPTNIVQTVQTMRNDRDSLEGVVQSSLQQISSTESYMADLTLAVARLVETGEFIAPAPRADFIQPSLAYHRASLEAKLNDLSRGRNYIGLLVGSAQAQRNQLGGDVAAAGVMQQGREGVHSSTFSASESLPGSFSGAEPMSASFSGAEPLSASFSGAEPMYGSSSGAEPMYGSFSSAESMPGSFSGAEPMSGSFSSAESMPRSFSGAESLSSSTSPPLLLPVSPGRHDSQLDSDSAPPNLRPISGSSEPVHVDEPAGNPIEENSSPSFDGGVGYAEQKRLMEEYMKKVNQAVADFVKTGNYIWPEPPANLVHPQYVFFLTNVHRLMDWRFKLWKATESYNGVLAGSHEAILLVKCIEEHGSGMTIGMEKEAMAEAASWSQYFAPPALSEPLDLSPRSVDSACQNLRNISESSEPQRDIADVEKPAASQDGEGSSFASEGVGELGSAGSDEHLEVTPPEPPRDVADVEEPAASQDEEGSSTASEGVGKMGSAGSDEHMEVTPTKPPRDIADVEKPAASQDEESSSSPSAGEGKMESAGSGEHVEVAPPKKKAGNRNRLWCKCGKNYAHKTSLRRHMFSHDRGKIFECETCGAKYALHSSLKSHVQSKHDVTYTKMFGCRLCGATLSTMTNLIRHRYEAHQLK